MFLNATKLSGWSAKTNSALFCSQLIWIKSARKITKKIPNHKIVSVFIPLFFRNFKFLQGFTFAGMS